MPGETQKVSIFECFLGRSLYVLVCVFFIDSHKCIFCWHRHQRLMLQNDQINVRYERRNKHRSQNSSKVVRKSYMVAKQFKSESRGRFMVCPVNRQNTQFRWAHKYSFNPLLTCCLVLRFENLFCLCVFGMYVGIDCCLQMNCFVSCQFPDCLRDRFACLGKHGSAKCKQVFVYCTLFGPTRRYENGDEPKFCESDTLVQLWKR